jgi:hypothetical protein
LHYQIGEGTVSATNVYPPQAWLWGYPIEEDRTDKAAPTAHHSLVAGPVIETRLPVNHGQLSVTVTSAIAIGTSIS